MHHAAYDLSWILRVMARQLTAEDVHVVRTTLKGEIDCSVADESIPQSGRVNPDALATECWRLAEQGRSSAVVSVHRATLRLAPKRLCCGSASKTDDYCVVDSTLPVSSQQDQCRS